MPKATYVGGTRPGDLITIAKCYIKVGPQTIYLKALPEIADSKQAIYSDTPVPGRSQPIKSYGYSSVRSITMKLHFYVTHPDDVSTNMRYLRLLESLVYPRTTPASQENPGIAPFYPPTVCRLKCGNLLNFDQDICAVLKQYQVSFPIDVAWDPIALVPCRFDVDTTWEVVYTTRDLPGAEKIFDPGLKENNYFPGREGPYG